MKHEPVEKTDFKDLNLLNRGKVRDVYDLGDHLLVVATDRISAFDHVLSPAIPGKGKVLTAISEFWFEHVSPLVNHHLVTTEIDEMPPEVHKYKDVAAGRSMLVKKAEVFPVECIVRGYITGSAWKEYTKSGTVCGERIPVGLVESESFPEPIFTPSTKATEGHDENISYQALCTIIGREFALELRTRSIEIFKVAGRHALEAGIILADTKFEWGMVGSDLVLVDEIFTPDSSRFWPEDDYEKGRSQKSFDKQYVRDHLTSTGWDKNSTPPELPEDVVAKTFEKYMDAYTRITGRDGLPA